MSAIKNLRPAKDPRNKSTLGQIFLQGEVVLFLKANFLEMGGRGDSFLAITQVAALTGLGDLADRDFRIPIELDGVFDCLVSPISKETLNRHIMKAYEYSTFRNDRSYLRQQVAMQYSLPGKQ